MCFLLTLGKADSPRQSLYASLVFYNLGLSFVKVSILYQYHRVFVSPGMRRAIWTAGAFSCATALALLCANLFMCNPIPRFWNKAIEGHCADQLTIWFTAATLNIISDVVIFLLPMPALKALHLPRRQKLGLMAVFALGVLYVSFSLST